MDKELSITNEMLKSALVGEYKCFVDTVDPKEIIDVLIQEKILSLEDWNKIATKESRQEKCRYLLDKIFTTSNPTSCIITCEALHEYYPWIYEQIKQKIKLQEHSADADSGEVIERLRKENSFVLCQLEEKNKKIKEFESLQKSKNASDEGDSEGSHASCREQNQKLQMQIDDLKRRLEEKKVENTNLNSHVSILESQIRASAVRIKSHEDILDFDEGMCYPVKLTDSLKYSKSEDIPYNGVKIIYPEEVIRVCKLPNYCGPYYDLYNGRFGPECLSISIKELIKDSAEATEDRLKHEALLTCQLDHPRLTKLLGQSGDCPQSYLIYESSYIPNVRNYLKYKCAVVEDSMLIRWCVQIACALEHIHSKRIILRNLELINILVVNEGTSVKLTNFEHAVQLPADSAYYIDESEPSGLMEKFAPETWTERKWLEATDVWSFGLTVLKLITRGAKLFPFKTERDVRLEIMKEELMVNTMHCYSTIRDSATQETIKECLMKDHQMRPSMHKLTYFTAYQTKCATDYSKLKESMLDEFIDHVLENKMQVRSITTLNNFLFFLVNSSSSIKCYRMSNGYERLKSIKLGLSRRNTLKRFFENHTNSKFNNENSITPSQKLLSICGTEDFLFVLDGENDVVWKVAATKRKVLMLFKVPKNAVSIQCSTVQTVTVFCKQPSLSGLSAIEYNLDGLFVRSVLRGLPQEPLHQGLCIDQLHTLVLCGDKQADEPSLQLRVLDSDGTASSGYGNLTFHNISDFCIHQPTQTIFLADLVRNRILLVDIQLQLEPLLLLGLDHGINCPSAIHIDSNGSLYVGLVSGNVYCFHSQKFNTPQQSPHSRSSSIFATHQPNLI